MKSILNYIALVKEISENYSITDETKRHLESVLLSALVEYNKQVPAAPPVMVDAPPLSFFKPDESFGG